MTKEKLYRSVNGDYLYLFNWIGGGFNDVWAPSKKEAYRRIITRFENVLWVISNKLEKSNVKSYGSNLTLIDTIPNLISLFCRDDNWLRQKQDSSLGKILFKNGYFDGRAKHFYDQETYGFNPNILFFDRINHDFGQF
jgi:hypothetical protein